MEERLKSEGHRILCWLEWIGLGLILLGALGLLLGVGAVAEVIRLGELGPGFFGLSIGLILGGALVHGIARTVKSLVP